MVNLQWVDQKLKEFIKLKEFAVAVKTLKSVNVEKLREEYPKAKIPYIDLKIKVVTCQAMAMVRKYGWELILSANDISCPTGLVTLGFVETIDSMLQGIDKLTPFNQDAKARAKRMQLLTQLPLHLYEGIMLSPIDRAQFNPDLIVIYGNSAQIMRLVQGALFHEGGILASTSAGGQGCSQYLTYPLIHNECRYVLPGNGDRIFGLTGDDQMIFSMPNEKITQTIEGIVESHKGGQRYPIPSYLLYEAKLPNSYQELSQKLISELRRGKNG